MEEDDGEVVLDIVRVGPTATQPTPELTLCRQFAAVSSF